VVELALAHLLPAEHHDDGVFSRGHGQFMVGSNPRFSTFMPMENRGRWVEVD
jgi:hypothetical protein